MAAKDGELEVRAEASPVRCPYCHDALGDPDGIVACGPCGARHHAACWAEHEACASCGDARKLVPVVPATAPLEPPRGSAITVERRGGDVLYSWPAVTRAQAKQAWLLVALVVTAPIGAWLLLAHHRRRRLELVLSDDSVTFQLYDSSETLRLRRDEIDAIRVIYARGAVAIDRGIERHLVRSGLLAPALSGPELEWLAETLRRWRRGDR